MSGDENGSGVLFNNLIFFIPLFVRNYVHKKQSLYLPPKLTNNMLFMPLGQSEKVPSEYETIPANTRSLNWSFIGDVTVDSQKRFVLDLLIESKQMPSFVIDVVGKEKAYSNSVFVPCVVDGNRLESCRIYEACEFGAIPVVVGTTEQIVESFKFLQNPPWLFASSWLEARQKMEALLSKEKSEELNAGQVQVQQWWSSCKQFYRDTINKVVSLQ